MMSADAVAGALMSLSVFARCRRAPPRAIAAYRLPRSISFDAIIAICPRFMFDIFDAFTLRFILRYRPSSLPLMLCFHHYCRRATDILRDAARQRRRFFCCRFSFCFSPLARHFATLPLFDILFFAIDCHIICCRHISCFSPSSLAARRRHFTVLFQRLCAHFISSSPGHFIPDAALLLLPLLQHAICFRCFA